MKKYRLEIMFAENSDNCEYIEESFKEEEQLTLEMDDNAVYMTRLLYPLSKDSPQYYHQAMNVALVSGCIVGDA